MWLFGNSELPLFDLLLFLFRLRHFLEKKEQAMYRQERKKEQAVCRKEKKRSKVCMRWILEREEDGEKGERGE